MRAVRAAFMALVLFGAPGVCAPAEGAGGGPGAQVRISQVCGAGGLNDSCPPFDFVELHNAGGSAASLAGWTLQLGLGSSATWTAIPLEGLVIPAGGYALVRCEPVLVVGAAPLATPDIAAATPSPLLSHTGKVALVEGTQVLTVGDPRGVPALRDLVGYGIAGPAEGTRAPSPGAGPPARVLVRRCGGERDTGDNATDFVLTAYAPALPRSTAAPAWTPRAEVVWADTVPARVPLGGSALLRVRADFCGGPPVQVRVDLSALGGGGGEAVLRDDGTQGDAAAGDGLYSLAADVSAAPPGVWSLPVTLRAVDGGPVVATGSLALVVLPGPLEGMKISQVYAGGGVDPSGFAADYVELHNAGETALNLRGATLLVAGPVGSTWTRVALSGVVPAGGFVLVQMGESAAIGRPLPAPDFVAQQSLLLSSGGKVALVADPLPGVWSCPGGADRVVDLVGAGQADCREGAGAASNAPWPGLAQRAILRICDGYSDTDVNAADWIEGTPAPRSSGDPPAAGVTIASVAAEPTGPVVAGDTVVVRVSVVDCVGRGLGQISVLIDGTEVAGGAASAVPARDDGAWPDTVAGDGQYAGAFVVGPAAPEGQAQVRVRAQTPDGRFASGAASVQVAAAPVGACCTGAACVRIGRVACEAMGGRWLGAGSACGALGEGDAGVPYSGIPALPNPIFDLTADTYTFTIAGTGRIIGPGGVRLALRLQHTWVGDLTIELSNVDGNATIVERIGRTGGAGPGSDANLDGWYVFHELAAASIWDAAAAAGSGSSALVPPGEYRSAEAGSGLPGQPGLRVFAGQPLDGQWRLRIRDEGVGDSGFLLALTLGDNAVRSACCPGDWNADGLLDPDDLADLISCYFGGGCPRADVDGSGNINPDDLADGIGAYFSGCP